MSRVTIVAGAGRSGTSTVAGTLALLGLYVPGPEVPADETNPRGFHESQWVVDFHKAMLRRSPVVRTLDSRPEAPELARTLPTPSDAEELDEWLGGALAEAPTGQVLVKDPRILWFHDLWRDVATARGAEVGFLTMLRHPVEVAKSRDEHYTADRGDEFRRHRATANIAAWCNACLVTEEVTRADARSFVSYVDLLADWRGALAGVVDRLGLEVDLGGAAAAQVDAFIDPDLRRSETTWDFVDVPDTLRAVAEGVWEEMNRLVADPTDPAVPPAVTRLRSDYRRLHDHAVAIALDHTRSREVHVRRRTRANVREEYEAQIAELEQQLEEAHHGDSDEDVDDRPRGLFGLLRG